MTKYSIMPRTKLAKSQAVLRAAVVKSLAHPSRILMVDALGHGELCVCELAELVGADISTVSKHLSVLKAAGLVSVEKRGLNQFYRLKCACLGDFFRCVDSINRDHSRSLKEACCV
jgi:ArsR family transcriptional regulator